MCIKDKIDDIRSLSFERSFDARLAISKKGDQYPIKSVSMHKSCSTPLWKLALIVLGAVVTVAMICHLCKKPKCEEMNKE